MYFVVDANAIKEFQDERIKTSDTAVQEAMALLLENGPIVLDEGDHILSEWLSCASYSSTEQSLSDWIDEMILERRIIIESINKNKEAEKKLATYGMPKRDRKYVHVGISVSAHSIVTDDIDFHDPKKKGCSATDANKLKSKKNGTLCKFLRNSFSINVAHWPDLSALLS